MIYLDNAATTKPCAEAVAAVNLALTELWGNPSSKHDAGRAAKKRLDAAKQTILDTLGAKRAPLSSLIFTGSGTEATNLAILGVCRSKERRGRVIIGDGEHASVNAAAGEAERLGFEVVRVPTKGGVIDANFLRESVTSDTVLLSLMLVNNETGALYDVRGAFETAKNINPNVICHCDAVQGYMKVPFTVKDLGADLITLSAHKIHGPKGIGALYVAPEIYKRREISPIVFGGGQEGGFRSGTENMPAILGFAAAAERAFSHRKDEIEALRSLRETAIEKLGKMPEITLNLPEDHAPHILSVTLPGIKSETMLHHLAAAGIAVSSGSACSSNSAKTISTALMAWGLSPADADSTVRVSFSAENTAEDIDALTDAIAAGIARLARIRK